MDQFSDVLKAIGPNASIIFAAWIFMGFLQQRYDSATDRYREAVGEYRANDHEDERSGNLRDQILTYRRRCKLMGWATLIGLAAAILLIVSLMVGALNVLIPHTPLIMDAGTGTALIGFALVIAAAIIVMIENQVVHRQLDDELRDVPELAENAGRTAERSRR